MIGELGHFALILAFCFALLQTALPTYGILKHHKGYLGAAKPLAIAQFSFCALAFVMLAYSFVVYDFSIAYVAQHSSRELPFAYRVCAVWGGHEGSMLLWVSLLGLWTSAIIIGRRGVPPVMLARVIAILGAISSGFFLFILATSNPFLRLLNPIPENGRDLNPLLQDMGFWVHPPILYAGYVGFAVAFAFALAALLARRYDTHWVRWARPWTLIAWGFLTLGITLGSWWAYRVLGWGGWWFWDPVENASLMPWLLGTGLLHAFAVADKRQAYQAWTLFLALSCFALSLLGTFIVRSGVLTSVHAFAVDPSRGVYMLAFLMTVVGVSWAVYAWRAGNVRSIQVFHLFSRETALLLNSVLVAVMTFTVLLGTLYPLMIEALGLGKLSVGAPYFNKVMIPLMIPVLLLMVLGPKMVWQQFNMRALFKRVWLTGILTIVIVLLVNYIFPGGLNIESAIIFGLAVWIILSTTMTRIQSIWRFSAMTLAHVGVAVTIIGITMTSLYSVERDVRMALGDKVSLANYEVRLVNTIPIEGPNYEGVSAEFHVMQQEQIVATLHAQRKFYPIPRTMLTEAAVSAGFFRDFYVALGEPLSADEWAVRLYYKPFIRWIWFGGLLMLMGGLLAASRRWTSAEE